MTTKEEIHRLVEALGEDDARTALDYIRALGQEAVEEDEALPPEELAAIHEELNAMRQGNYVTLEEYERARGL